MEGGAPSGGVDAISTWGSRTVRFALLAIVSTPKDNTASSPGPPGSIDLQHWNDQCVFADSLADLGRWVELWVEAARAMVTTGAGAGAGNPQWVARTWPQVKLMTEYILALRANATTNVGIGKGLIYGPAEFDECMYQQHWFSVSAWNWRGLLQLQRFLVDTAVIVEPTLAAKLAVFSERFSDAYSAPRCALSRAFLIA